MRRYYVTPPTNKRDVPFFIRKHYNYDEPAVFAGYVKELIVWATQEYRAALRSAAERGAFRFVKFLNEEYSPMRILAESEGFKEILKMMDERNYNILSGRDRIFVRRSYELFKAFS
jgi:hypothetical protein